MVCLKAPRNLFLSIIILFELSNLDTSAPSFLIGCRFDNIDLEALSDLLNKDHFSAKGKIEGRLYVKGTATSIDKVDIQLDSLEPGGEVRSKYLSRLISFIPQEQAREAVASTIKGGLFVFKKASVGMLTDDGGHKLHILLDGQHLLDFNINVPRDVLNDALRKLKEVK